MTIGDLLDQHTEAKLSAGLKKIISDAVDKAVADERKRLVGVVEATAKEWREDALIEAADAADEIVKRLRAMEEWYLPAPSK